MAWANLLPELLLEILKKLGGADDDEPSDELRFSWVCSSWRACALLHRTTALLPLHTPIMFNPYAPYFPTFSTLKHDYDLVSNTKILRQFCSTHGGRNILRCVGSYRGWLILSREELHDDSVHMFICNPFWNKDLDLPISTVKVEQVKLSKTRITKLMQEEEWKVSILCNCVAICCNMNVV